jgi:hypothetical protein
MWLERGSYLLIWVCLPFAVLGITGLSFGLIFPVSAMAEFFKEYRHTNPLEITGNTALVIALTAVTGAFVVGVVRLGWWLMTRVETAVTTKTPLSPRVWRVSLMYNAFLGACFVLLKYATYQYSSPYSLQDALEDSWLALVVPVLQMGIAALGWFKTRPADRQPVS